jgi:hypothetical protein
MNSCAVILLAEFHNVLEYGPESDFQLTNNKIKHQEAERNPGDDVLPLDGRI